MALRIILIFSLYSCDISKSDVSSSRDRYRKSQKIKTYTILPFDTKVIFFLTNREIPNRLITIIVLDDSCNTSECESKIYELLFWNDNMYLI